MPEEQLQLINEAVAKAIQINVNGKIDKMNLMVVENIATVNNMRQEISVHNELHGKDMKRETYKERRFPI